MHDLPRLKCIFPSRGLLRGVRWFDTDVSGLPVSLMFSLTVEDGGPIDSAETSVSNHFTLRNNHEAEIIQFEGLVLCT